MVAIITRALHIGGTKYLLEVCMNEFNRKCSKGTREEISCQG